MLKKGLVLPIVIVLAIFLTLSATMFFLQEKSLVGYITYDVCPGHIYTSGTTTLEADVPTIDNCGGNNGINISVSNVILDCDGYTITGSQEKYSTGILIEPGLSNVTIQNCIINNFDTGVSVGGGSSATIENSTITNANVACYTGNLETGEGNGGCLASSCTHLIQNMTGEWQNLTCVVSDEKMNQTRNITEYDANDCGNFTNVTYTEYNLAGPTYANTSFTDWENYQCSENEMQQIQNATQYDIYGCAENTTVFNYSLIGPTYTNVSVGEWTDSTCVNSSTKNQSREIIQSDIYDCADNQTITEYQSVSCSSGYSCSSGVCTKDDDGGGGGGGGGGCTPSTCSSLGKTCGTQSNGCGGTLNCGTCEEGYNCEEGTCILQEIPCENECNTTDYPKCKNSNTSESCSLNSDTDCYEIKEDACSDEETCVDGICEIQQTEEEKDNPVKEVVEGITSLAKKPSSIIPHGNVPEVVVDTAAYTATTAVVATGFHFLWLWLISLFLPVFLLRLKHFCLAFIDTKTLLPFVGYNKKGESTDIKKKEIEKFISLLQKQFRERIILSESTKTTYRFLFEKSGFIELQLDAPIVINVHFSSSRRTRKFKKALLNTIKIMYGIEKMKKVESGLILTKESSTIIRALRNISRERKLRKISRRFK